ncbi:PREDICTED: sister chromatid cohesion 1 protein 4 [Nelumbo nucifera]|uniref:Sister chromatid cohesion 1 protein 4 n=2 Tax=Nelumbo nucifera TaxID=4432 RepID=A0A1U7Z6I2_NELNU|nr:PREDICTED: sister chromatid cohesion 1 protein 4 [Nelumbo nucifera]DAD25170.1 TPA_asm: hypothetical protein HUJ06_026634 [Nelumbo nucifera]
MFYSQFILAKKGPLGTIWIAAHLERKLRKNQVADTDIGVSVDSILFPEAPIALRLSSHLLLGVVRIYSRKVNYLFHDCSEALLKVKQAFRSTAVDLPPEESTAPYHSITLPETFDLDDFELPDSAFFQGNYVDHHISTREQITLQDTMDGVVYSTSQFGLDERFGDGDASQIGLDLDEDLFLNKDKASGHSVATLDIDDDVDLQACGQPMTPFTMYIDDDQNNEDRTTDIEVMEDANGKKICFDLQDPMRDDNSNILHGDPIQTPDQNDVFHCNPVEGSCSSPSKDLVECAHAPFTPGLVEEAIQVKQQRDSPSAAEGMEHMASDVSRSVSSPTSVLVEQPKPVSPLSECSDRVVNAPHGHERADELQIGATSNKIENNSSIDLSHSEAKAPQGLPLEETVSPACDHQSELGVNTDCSSKETEPQALKKVNPVAVGSLTEAYSPDHASSSRIDSLLESNGGHELDKVEAKTCVESQDFKNLDTVNSVEKVCPNCHVLRACSSNQNQSDSLSVMDGNLVENTPELSPRGVGLCSCEISEREEVLQASGTDVQGEACQPTNLMDTTLETTETLGPPPEEDLQVDRNESDEHLDNGMPAPEIMLSAPSGVTDLPNNLVVESTPDKADLTENIGNGDDFEILSGKKRHSMESTPILQSGNSAKLSGVPRSKRTMGSIPDDDDLLSSILVGRRTSVLKLRPTPPLHEAASSKRPRVASRNSVPKRKILLDDTMVLHGDTIRQQLTNTEDIRRVRRKAPCTPSEIWMIQKNLLEAEIFGEPIFTGMSLELIDLHNQTYDLTELEAVKDVEHSPTTNLTKESKNSSEPVTVVNDGEAQPGEMFVLSENQQFEGHAAGSVGCEGQYQTMGPAEVTQLESSKDGLLGQITAMEADTRDGVTSEAVDHIVTANPLAGDNCHVSSGLIIESSPLDGSSGTEAMNDKLCSSANQESGSHSFEHEASLMDRIDVKEVDAFDVSKENEVNLVLSEGVSQSNDRSPLEECEDCRLVDMMGPNVPQECGIDIRENTLYAVSSPETRSHLSDSSTPFENGNPSLPIVSAEGGEQTGAVITTGDGTVERMESEVMVEKMGNDEDNPSFNPVSGEESEKEFNMAIQDDSLDGVENPCNWEANSKSTMDTETEISAFETADVRGSDDFGNIISGNDTEFLNVDDEDVDDEEDNGIPRAEEAQFFENSGWSSRTRAVARYLQTLFDNEAGHGRRELSMDNLLAGKTRKEASRMFFETLVLKTRDYIHVEQGNPFDKINIKPKVKLMKSDF